MWQASLFVDVPCASPHLQQTFVSPFARQCVEIAQVANSTLSLPHSGTIEPAPLVTPLAETPRPPVADVAPVDALRFTSI